MAVRSALALVAALLAFEPPASAEAEEPEPYNPWQDAGARGWAACDRLGAEARAHQGNLVERALTLAEGHLWAARAVDCPHEPSVLALAATQEIYRRFPLPERVDDAAAVEKLRQEQLESLAEAERWLEEGARERVRRGLGPDIADPYLRARIALSRSRPAAVRAWLEPAMARGQLPQWRARRLLALAAVLEGELEGALAHALVAVRQAPTSELALNRYVYALALDRAGSPADAARWVREARDMDRDQAALFTVASMLPIHERLYLRALERTVMQDVTGATRLWDAYLARPEPEDPERRLAERHREQLEPPPERLR